MPWQATGNQTRRRHREREGEAPEALPMEGALPAPVIEVKESEHISDVDLKGIRALSEEKKLKRKIVVSRETTSRTTSDGIELWPINPFLEGLWGGEFK